MSQSVSTASLRTMLGVMLITAGCGRVDGVAQSDAAAQSSPSMPAPVAAGFPVRTQAGDLGDASALAVAIPDGTGMVFHLAAVVSAAAEADYDLGIRVNLLGTLAVVNRCRALASPPRVVFPSSVASFGGGQDARVADDARQVPTNSYGAQKAMAEMLLNDASRRGFLDAVCIRLPTVVVRPGRPNKAASSFASAILREPLLGLATDCPVFPDFRLWICSPRSATGWFLHAATMDTAPLGLERGVNPPGMTASVAEMLDALEGVAGAEARQRVQIVPDTVVQDIVRGWPSGFVPDRALGLGFSAHESLAEVVRAFIAEDLAATKADRGLVLPSRRRPGRRFALPYGSRRKAALRGAYSPTAPLAMIAVRIASGIAAFPGPVVTTMIARAEHINPSARHIAYSCTKLDRRTEAVRQPSSTSSPKPAGLR